MIELSPMDRLKIFALDPRGIKMRDVRLSPTPGFVIWAKKNAEPVEIDIRGVGYPARVGGKYQSVLRLWNELHEHFNTNVTVLTRKYGVPTRIEWNGLVYHAVPFAKGEKK